MMSTVNLRLDSFSYSTICSEETREYSSVNLLPCKFYRLETSLRSVSFR